MAIPIGKLQLYTGSWVPPQGLLTMYVKPIFATRSI